MNNSLRYGASLRMACSCLPALLLALAMAGCVDKAGQGADEADLPQVDVQELPAPGEIAAPGISAAYLRGPWCYLHYEAGGERSIEDIDHVFNEDGTLLYRNNPQAPLDNTGSWKIQGNTLAIGPALAMVFPTEIESVEDDRFVLGNGSTRLVFARGACDEQDVAPAMEPAG